MYNSLKFNVETSKLVRLLSLLLLVLLLQFFKLRRLAGLDTKNYNYCNLLD